MGWRSQKEIRKLLIEPSVNYKIKYPLNEQDFLLGSKQAYYMIYRQFFDKKDFRLTHYTTPKLSRAINNIIHHTNYITQPLIHTLNRKILHSWIEVGNAKSNDRLFGTWDYNHIQYEFRYSNCWDIYVGPFKQKVKVLYKRNQSHIDVWEFEKCLMK